MYGSASESVLKGVDVVQSASLCLGALRCTHIELLKVESPLLPRREQLLLTYMANKTREPSDHPSLDFLFRRGKRGDGGDRLLAE